MVDLDSAPMITDGTRIWGTLSSTQREVLLNCSSSETNASRLSGVMPTDSSRCSKAGSTGSGAKAFCAPDGRGDALDHVADRGIDDGAYYRPLAEPDEAGLPHINGRRLQSPCRGRHQDQAG